MPGKDEEFYLGNSFALEVDSVKELGFAVAIPTALIGLALVVTPLAGFSLYGYVFNRAATITTSGRSSISTNHFSASSFFPSA